MIAQLFEPGVWREFALLPKHVRAGGDQRRVDAVSLCAPQGQHAKGFDLDRLQHGHCNALIAQLANGAPLVPARRLNADAREASGTV
jgi:hypothetical protein